MSTTTENIVFIITNTAGIPVAAIQPNTLNGPDGIQTSSDLSLFGIGYPTWGQAADQNDYRLLEHFACPESAPGVPQTSAVLGDGNGINTPIIGMMWYNTTQSKMFMYTASGWALVAGGATVPTVQPTPPATGELWYNTAIPQLEVYNGSAWVSVAALYLPLSGGTLSGDINLNTHNLLGATNVDATAVNATYYRALNGVTTNQITIPTDGSATLLDGPRIGNYVIYHTGNLPATAAPYIVGMTIMWAGIVSNIPTGWALCDGGVHNGYQVPNMSTGLIPSSINSGNIGARTLTITTSAISAGTPTGTITLSTANLPSHDHQLKMFYEGTTTALFGPPTLPNTSNAYFHLDGNGSPPNVPFVISTVGLTGSVTPATVSGSALAAHSHSVSVSTVGLFFICYVG